MYFSIAEALRSNLSKSEPELKLAALRRSAQPWRSQRSTAPCCMAPGLATACAWPVPCQICPTPVPQSGVDRQATENSEENEGRVHRWHAVFGCARSMPSTGLVHASLHFHCSRSTTANRRMSSAVHTSNAFRRTASFRSQSPPIPESKRYQRFGCGVCRRHQRQEGLALNRPAVDGHRGEACTCPSQHQTPSRRCCQNSPHPPAGCPHQTPTRPCPRLRCASELVHLLLRFPLSVSRRRPR